MFMHAPSFAWLDIRCKSILLGESEEPFFKQGMKISGKEFKPGLGIRLGLK